MHWSSGARCRSSIFDYYASDLDTVAIIDQADEKLSQTVLTNPNHVFLSLLPDKTDQHYCFRARHHDQKLVAKVKNSSVIILQYIGCIEAVIDLCISLFLTTFNKDDDDDDDDDGLSHQVHLINLHLHYITWLCLKCWCPPQNWTTATFLHCQVTTSGTVWARGLRQM